VAQRDTFRDLGLEIRAGLHTGEVEHRQSSVAGLAVHIGARVASLAGAGEVLVTSVIRALVLGLAFAGRGIHSLKGVPDTGSCSQQFDGARFRWLAGSRVVPGSPANPRARATSGRIVR
jgi:hypothetical protein